MSEVRIVVRLWADKTDQMIMRKWEPKEYETVDPTLPFSEEYFVTECSCGRRFVCVKEMDAQKIKITHERLHGHKCTVGKEPIELVCVEIRERYCDKHDIWVSESEVYGG